MYSKKDVPINIGVILKLAPFSSEDEVKNGTVDIIASNL